MHKPILSIRKRRRLRKEPLSSLICLVQIFSLKLLKILLLPQPQTMILPPHRLGRPTPTAPRLVPPTDQLQTISHHYQVWKGFRLIAVCTHNSILVFVFVFFCLVVAFIMLCVLCAVCNNKSFLLFRFAVYVCVCLCLLC
jgi:hypothetical protein